MLDVPPLNRIQDAITRNRDLQAEIDTIIESLFHISTKILVNSSIYYQASPEYIATLYSGCCHGMTRLFAPTLTQFRRQPGNILARRIPPERTGEILEFIARVDEYGRDRSRLWKKLSPDHSDLRKLTDAVWYGLPMKLLNVEWLYGCLKTYERWKDDEAEAVVWFKGVVREGNELMRDGETILGCYETAGPVRGRTMYGGHDVVE